MMAILYRTNAQSRAIEDSLMRESIPYKIIGGVRFYERKEIKDALAYLKLIINPHDDVSLRRVINVPARGIGKGVMDSLQAIEPGRRSSRTRRRCWRPASRSRSPRDRCGRALVYAVDEAKLGNRARSPRCATFRDLIVGLADVARQDTVSITIGKMLDRTGYLNDLRDENSEEANERIENLMELVSAARDYETREAGAVARRVRRSAVAAVGGRTRNRARANAKVWMMTMHAAKGLEFPMVIIAGLEEGLFPHSRSAEDEDELEEERRLCYVGMTRARAAAGADRRRAAPRVRRVPVDASRHDSSTRFRPS